MNTITTSGTPQNTTKVSKLFVRRATINGKQAEHWNLNKIDAPLRWRKPRLAQITTDMFHPNVPDEWIDRVFAVMALCPQHTFQILTKRADRMREYMKPLRTGRSRLCLIADDAGRMMEDGDHAAYDVRYQTEWPLPNVWLGVSVEDKKRWDERWHHLASTPAAIRFISAEPLLGPIDMVGSGKLDWLICGGESGPKARPMHPDWARSLRDQCVAAGVPFFMKQMAKKAAIPDDLFIREMPNADT